MSSLWKDLLFLHGHFVRKEDLRWREQDSVASTSETAPAEVHADKTGAARMTDEKAPKGASSHWPPLAAPH